MNETTFNKNPIFYSHNSGNNPLFYPLINQSISYYSYPYCFINNVLGYSIKEDKQSIDSTRVSPNTENKISTQDHTQLPLFFNPSNTIKVPSKVEYALRRYTPKKLLKEIHPNIDVSVELCLLFTTQITSTYFEMEDGDTSQGWKALKAQYLRELLGISPLAYCKVAKALEVKLDRGAILECDHDAEVGVKSFHYRLGEAYIKKGIVSYQLKTPQAIRLLNKHYARTYSNCLRNPICANLIHFYRNITLPTIDEIWTEAKKLVKEKHITKKGKKLVFLNKHSKSYFKNPQLYSFVEDNMKLFEELTQDGLRIPLKGSEKSGGRVVDSFTLMSSWIRDMVKIGGRRIRECDYSCLHPNLAIAIYDGKQQGLQHADLAQKLGIDACTIKLEHLSFFNKAVWQMKKSPLYKYYQENEPEMMKSIINEKFQSPYKHKATSRKLFKKEVEIMEDVIVQLNAEGIYVGYIYDALFFDPIHGDRVKEVMDDIILKHGVKTTAKLDWSPIKNYEGIYEINVLGVVRSLHRKNFHHIMNQRVDRGGYYSVRLTNRQGTNTHYVHRLLGLTFLGNPNNKCCINHKDGNKLNNSLANLEFVTHSENMLHAYKTGLISSGNAMEIVDCITGEIYNSVKQAAEALGYKYPTLKNYINGNRTNPTSLRYKYEVPNVTHSNYSSIYNLSPDFNKRWVCSETKACPYAILTHNEDEKWDISTKIIPSIFYLSNGLSTDFNRSDWRCSSFTA